jgi:hypothetical protein
MNFFPFYFSPACLRIAFARAALQKELQHAEEERDRLDVVIAYLRERLREDEQERPAPVSSDGAARSTRASRSRSGLRSGPRRLTAAKAAEAVLTERDEPLRTPELLIAVNALGVGIKNADGLYRTLSRNPKFKRFGRGLWGLAEWPDNHGKNAALMELVRIAAAEGAEAAEGAG